MIDRSIDSTHSQLIEVEFEKVDRILDVAETAMLSVASEHRLREPQIVRWRWDQPEVLMSWSPIRQAPEVGKNIRASVVQEEQGSYRCDFESNAWFDLRESSDSFVRYWDHFPAGAIPHIDPEKTLSQETPYILEYVARAYSAVSDSDEVVLSHAVSNSTSGEARDVNGSAVIGHDFVETRESVDD